MKVALVRDLLEENWPSIEVYADRLAQGLRTVASQVDIIEVRAKAWSWGARSVRMPYGRSVSLHTLGLYLSRWIRYPWALRHVKADLYHVLDNSYGHLAFFLNPQRTLVTSHGGTPKSWRRWNPEGPAMWLFDLAFRGMLRAARVITVSAYAKEELLADSGYPADRVHIVHHGVDPLFRPVSEPERVELRRHLLPTEHSRLLLHVGHSAPRKNIEVLYRALALLQQAGQPVHLVRVGSNPTESQSRLIETSGIASAVTHVPYLSNRELPHWYSAADAFVFPSLYEGFGVPLIEAMACGTPVVCTDWALFREVCGDAACFVADVRQPEALAAAVARVLTTHSLAAGLRDKGFERARHFTWERVARETLAVYQRASAQL